MSFSDEIKASIRTPLEVAEEKEQEEINKVKSLAQNDFECLKRELNKNAESGRYRTVGGQRIIEVEAHASVREYCRITRQKQYRDRLFAKPEFCGIAITCECVNTKYYNVYTTELDKLTKPENITFRIVAKYTDIISKRSCYCYIPGSMSTDNYSVFPKEVDFCIDASMII